MRAAEYRHGQRRRLQQVVSAIGHQAATNESDVSQRIEKQQFPHGIAHQHRDVRRDSLCRGTSHRRKTLLQTQRMHAVETLGMTRHQNQQRIGVTGQ